MGNLSGSYKIWLLLSAKRGFGCPALSRVIQIRYQPKHGSGKPGTGIGVYFCPALREYFEVWRMSLILSNYSSYLLQKLTSQNRDILTTQLMIPGDVKATSALSRPSGQCLSRLLFSCIHRKATVFCVIWFGEFVHGGQLKKLLGCPGELKGNLETYFLEWAPSQKLNRSRPGYYLNGRPKAVCPMKCLPGRNVEVTRHHEHARGGGRSQVTLEQRAEARKESIKRKG